METYEDIIKNRVDLLLAIPKWLFNITLGVNTVLFLLGLIAIGDESLPTTDFYLMTATVVINILVFLCLIVFSFVYSNYRKSLMMSSLILLLNIPIATLYLIIISAFEFKGAY